MRWFPGNSTPAAAIGSALVCTLVLHGCASWSGQELPLPAGGERAVPPAPAIAVVTPAPIGENVIARYDGDIGAKPSTRTVEPMVSLMPVAPPSYGPPGVAIPRPGYALYPPPPPPGSSSMPEPYERAVERAIGGGIIGGIIGAQIGSGTGRHAAAGVGAATGALIGLGTSGNPCAAPHGGTLAGAAIGGILGNRMGEGSGRSAATAVGAVLGALAGTQAAAAQADCR